MKQLRTHPTALGTMLRRGAAARWAALLGLAWRLPALAVRRFPRPDFTVDYVPPAQNLPAARAQMLEYMDVAVLAVALVLAGYLVLRRRSRRGVLLLSVFAIAYFGFWRRGCVCAVGAVQNVALGFADAGYAIPLTVVALFALPLAAALFQGRTFCAGVCPLGAVQDVFVWRPVKVPVWLNHVLGMVPWIVLSIAVLFASTGTGFPICRWDPFVGFFRLGAPFHMLVIGLLVLAVGVVVARPYCRFLCPYGVLLGTMSKLSRRHATITPAECIQCRLCEDACPFGAIRKPRPSAAPEARAKGIRRLALILAIAPLVMLGAAGTGFLFGNLLSRANSEVTLALEIHRNVDADLADMSLEREAFFTSGLPADDLYAEARSVQARFAVGGAVLGAVLALIACAKLLGLSVWRSQTDYEPDRAQCFSCARCFASCPVGRKHREADREP